MKTFSKYMIGLCLGLLLSSEARSQIVAFNDLARLQNKEQRPVLVFIHTSWCRYCGSMSNSLQRNRQINDLISREFYVVLLDGEEKNNIRFAGRDFRFKPTGANTGTHELAAALGTLNGQISYPSICFLNVRNEIVYQHAGFLDPPSLLAMLKAVSDK
ncbi:DUF255 domain-containing protein [Flavihumibacter sp. R14]|nr:DUF255 domain-containing protein [Flavihumibacter soli]